MFSSCIGIVEFPECLLETQLRSLSLQAGLQNNIHMCLFHFDMATNKASNNNIHVKSSSGSFFFYFCQGRISGLTGLMDFRAEGSNSHVQFEILGTSYSETFGKDVKRVSSGRSQDILFRSEVGMNEMKHYSEKKNNGGTECSAFINPTLCTCTMLLC